MGDMWDFLCNNSPTLIFKPRSKTPCFLSEPKEEIKKKPFAVISNVKKINKTPLKLDMKNVPNTNINKIKPNKGIMTVRTENKFIGLPREQSKKNLTPIVSVKKITPLLTSIKSVKILKIK